MRDPLSLDGLFNGDAPMPQALDAERALLGSVLMYNAVLDDVQARPEHFYQPRNEAIFRAMLKLKAAGVAIDTGTLREELRRAGELELAGDVAYLAELDFDLPDADRAPFYAEIIRDAYGRRRALEIARQVITAAMAGEDLVNVVGTAATGLDAVINDRAGGGYVEMSVCALELAAYVDEEQRDAVGARTGIGGVDRLILAMEAGQQWLIAARSGIGKTALMLQIAHHELFTQGRRVGIVSLEMTRRELMMRLVARESMVPFSKIRARNINSDEGARVRSALRRMQHAALWIDDAPGQTPAEIVSRARTMKRKHGVNTTILDYLTLVREPSKDGRQDLKIDRITNEFQNLAKDLDETFITLGQLGKRGDLENRQPILADLKDAGEAAMYGALILHRETNPDNRSLSKPQGSVTVAKNRGGPTGEVRTMFDGASMTWRQMTPEEETSYNIGRVANEQPKKPRRA